MLLGILFALYYEINWQVKVQVEQVKAWLVYVKAQLELARIFIWCLGVYLRNKLSAIKDGAYVKNIDDFKSIVTHWIALYVNGNNRRASYNAIYLDGIGVEHSLKIIRRKQKYQKNIYRIQAYNTILCGYLCIWLIDFMLKGKSLLDYTNLFSPNDYERNDNIVLKYFQ